MSDRDHPPATLHVLILPGLNDSGPAHWQTWLQARWRGVRVRQADWQVPDLDAWSAEVSRTTQAWPRRRWLAVAHSFGCLALVRHLQLHADSPIEAALLVAPAEPDRFGVADRLPHDLLPVPSTLVASETDPWMSAASARRWAARWGSRWISQGDAGHINVDSGHHTLPLADGWLRSAQRRWARRQRPLRASWAEWSFAV